MALLLCNNAFYYLTASPFPLHACSGGMELLFGNEKLVDVDVPAPNGDALTVGQAMAWARDNILTERPEMFMKGDTMYVFFVFFYAHRFTHSLQGQPTLLYYSRPGVLVLINDADWELRYVLFYFSVYVLMKGACNSNQFFDRHCCCRLLCSGLDESPLTDGDRVAFISTLHGG